MKIDTDITFCNFYKDCVHGNKCFRAKTDKINKLIKDKEVWVFTSQPECFVKKNERK